MDSASNRRVLVSGASFAGLAAAFWMRRLGYDVTVVEIAEAIKKGGTPVNIRGNTIAVVRRMGLYDAIRANRLPMHGMAFKDAADVTVGEFPADASSDDEYEIERDLLLQLMFELVKDDVELRFGDTITALQEGDGVDVTFRSGATRSFALVFGCDGIHSAVRRLWFGEESEFSHFMQAYFSITIVNQLLIPQDTAQMYNEPGKAVMLNAYNGKTDIILCFAADEEIPYDYRNEAQQRALIAEQFAGQGWRVPELLDEVKKSKTFYFDKLCQLKMPSWTRGRVALVGDAGYCASPAAGMGGSLALDGAAALADAFAKHGEDLERVFEEYNRSFRPFLEQVQANAASFGVEMLLPRTEEAIRMRNEQAATP